MKTYEVRYVGMYGDSLYDYYASYEQALQARVAASNCARAHGETKIAASFYIR